MNKLKLLKEKKNELYEVNKEFLAETLNASALLHEALSTFTNDKLKKESLKGVIQAEKRCDELKDKFTQVLYRDKRALPFLIEDRFKNPSKYSVVLISEGAMYKGGAMIFEEAEKDQYGHAKLGGIGDVVSQKLKESSLL